MGNKVIIAIVLTVVFVFSLVVVIPFVILSDTYSNFGLIDQSKSYFYAPSNSSTKTVFNLDIDKGEVEIKYVDPSYDFSVKIEVHFEISGANVRGKSYLDYFNIIWSNESSPLNFKMTYQPDIDLVEVSSLFKNVSVVVFLRTEVIFDINATMTDGTFDITVPFMVPIDNINVNIDKGDIFFNFLTCLIGGNITGTVKTGNIDFIAFELQYSRNCIWNLTIGKGDLLFDIIQSKDMGANITGAGKINAGELRVLYKDYNPDVGALFIFHRVSSINEAFLEGFQEPIDEVDEDQWWLVRNFVYSDDFPALNYYNISLYRVDTDVSDYVYNLLNTNMTT